MANKKVKGKEKSSAKKVSKTKVPSARIKEQSTQPVPIIDVNKLVEEGDASLLAQREERRTKRQERVEARKELSSKVNAGLRIVHNKFGNGSKVVNAAGDARAVTANIPDSLKGLTTSLKDIKNTTREESRKQRPPLYINVMQDGSFDYSGRYDKDSSLHCYLNGSEVAMIIPKKAKKNEVKQIENDSNEEEVMEKKTGKTVKTVAKVATKKESADRPAKVSGTFKPTKIKDIVAALKAKKVVRHERGFLPKLKNLITKNQDLMWPVSITKE